MFSRIVVGTDGSSTAKDAVALALGLAKQSGGTLHVVSAYQVSTSAVSVAVAAGAVGVTSLVAGDETQVLAESVLADAAAEAERQGVAVELHAVAGSAPDVLVKVATNVDADVIVVGSRGMQGARRVLGSVPNSVAHHAPCNVLVAKTC